MPNDLYKKADDASAFKGFYEDPKELDLRNESPIKDARNLARERARAAGGYRKSRKATRR